MIGKFANVVAAFAAVFVLSTAAEAAERATAEEAVAMVGKAVAMFRADGADKTFPAVNDKAGPFVKNELYVFVIDFSGKMLAHGANPGLVGKSLIDLKDANGGHLIQNMIAVAKDKGKGWVEYKWPNPVTKKIEGKASYVEKVTADVLFGAGIYK